MFAKKTIDLPTSKQLMLPVPGSPQRVNSLPMSLAVSPDKRWVITLDAGYGTRESSYEQSLSVLDTRSGTVRDFPDDRTLVEAKQTFYSGLAFSADGGHVYASLASLTTPEGDGKKKTGSGLVVYKFAEGVLTSERFLKLPLVKLAPGRHTLLREADGGTLAVPYPAAIAAFRPPCPKADCTHATEHLLVAENLSDTVAEIDAETGALVRHYDLASNVAVPSTYPIALPSLGTVSAPSWRYGTPARSQNST